LNAGQAAQVFTAVIAMAALVLEFEKREIARNAAGNHNRRNHDQGNHDQNRDHDRNRDHGGGGAHPDLTRPGDDPNDPNDRRPGPTRWTDSPDRLECEESGERKP
jgi:hypothetical protein